MIESITKYIEFLKKEYGLNISLHGKGLGEVLDLIAPYNAHECAYCMYVKSSSECWQRCRESQKKAEARVESEGAFFGSCYAGVGEFVFPITVNKERVGMISVGGYVGSAEKRSAFLQKYGFSEVSVARLKDSSLCDRIPELDFIKTLIDPLCAMLTLLIEERRKRYEESCGVYGKILSILHTDYMHKIKISDISERCHYSVSFISRLFREKNGKTINSYLNDLRMQKARELLLTGNMRIEDIAASVGFSDANYFISFFSKTYGMPPKCYKKANINLQNQML